MKIPLIDFLKNRGIHSGLGQTNNSIKMAGLILLPLIAPWLAVQIFFTKAEATLYTPFIFAGWIAVIVIYFFAKKASASEYIAFPQSHWRFSDGQQISYDVLVPPSAYEEVTVDGEPVKYSDGSHLYRVHFKDKCAYQDADRMAADVFDFALWKLPASWNDSFSRNGLGEFFFEGLFITHPTCENIDVAVVDWDERGASRIPICLITACSYYYRNVMRDLGKVLPDPKVSLEETKDAVIKDLKIKNASLTTRNHYLEEEAEEYSNHEPETVKELADNRLSAIAKRHGNIMNAKKSAWTKILNIKTLVYLGIAIIILVIIFYLTGMI